MPILKYIPRKCDSGGCLRFGVHVYKVTEESKHIVVVCDEHEKLTGSQWIKLS